MNTNLFWLLPVILVVVLIVVKLLNKKPDTSINASNIGGGSNPTPLDGNKSNTRGNGVNRKPLN
jgi:preprotein translocase subunit SecG